MAVRAEELAELEEEMAAFWRRARAATRDAAREVHPRLDAASYPALAVLFSRGPQRMSGLNAVLMLDKSTLSRQVDVLVRLDLVRRSVDPDDARARVVSLTPECRERLERLAERRRKTWHEGFASWPEGDVAAMADLLRRFGESGLT